jgi:hypothetical protein
MTGTIRTVTDRQRNSDRRLRRMRTRRRFGRPSRHRRCRNLRSRKRDRRHSHHNRDRPDQRQQPAKAQFETRSIMHTIGTIRPPPPESEPRFDSVRPDNRPPPTSPYEFAQKSISTPFSAGGWHAQAEGAGMFDVLTPAPHAQKAHHHHRSRPDSAFLLQVGAAAVEDPRPPQEHGFVGRVLHVVSSPMDPRIWRPVL